LGCPECYRGNNRCEQWTISRQIDGVNRSIMVFEYEQRPGETCPWPDFWNGNEMQTPCEWGAYPADCGCNNNGKCESGRVERTVCYEPGDPICATYPYLCSANDVCFECADCHCGNGTCEMVPGLREQCVQSDNACVGLYTLESDCCDLDGVCEPPEEVAGSCGDCQCGNHYCQRSYPYCETHDPAMEGAACPDPYYLDPGETRSYIYCPQDCNDPNT
jgi:hypothetical protein